MPILTSEEKKKYDTSPFIDKYYVESFYNYGFDDEKDYIDFEVIGRAREMDLVHDGENFCGRSNAYSFDIYNSLEIALKNHHKRIDKVEFSNLTDKEMVMVKSFIEQKMNDDNYLSKYGLKKNK